jgi:hypothetical protein
MVQDILCKVNSYSACQTIACFPYCVHKVSPLDSILSQLNLVHINPYLPKVHLNVILLPMPRSSWSSLPFGPPNQNPVSTSPLPHPCYMPYSPQPPWFNYPHNTRWRIQSMKFIIMQFSPWHIFLITLFSKTLSLCPSLKVRDQVSHPNSTTGKITVLYILIFRFFDMRQEDKRFWLNDSKHSLNLICSWFHHEEPG